jgi:hypothetical protein
VELFTIQCTTCKARLIVKDESVIGDILACPKCNSMVQVVPPVGWKRAGGDSSAQPAGIEPAASQPAAPQETAPVARKSAVRKAAAVIPPALPPRPAAPQTSTVARADAISQSSLATGSTAEAVSPPSWLSTIGPRAKQDWMLLGSGLLGGAVLGAAAWLFMAAQSPAPEIAAETATSDQAKTPAAAPEPAAGAVDAPVAGGSAAPPPVESPRAAEPSTRETDPAVADATPPVEATAESADEHPAEAPQPPAEDAAAAEAEPQAAADASSPALKLEPVRSPGIVSGGLSGDGANGTILPPATPSAADLPSGDGPQLADDAVSEAPLPRESALLSREEIQQRLDIALAEVEFAEVPLARFAAFISDVTGVSVAIDEAALGNANRRRNTPTSVKLAATTAGEALRVAVESIGLTYTVSDNGQIVITTRNR